MQPRFLHTFLNQQDDMTLLCTKEAIPYKNSKTELEEHGADVGFVVMGFLIITFIIFLLLKNKKLGSFSLVKKDKRLHVLEREKVTSRSSIVLIQYKNRFFLISQSGDNLALISEVDGKDI